MQQKKRKFTGISKPRAPDKAIMPSGHSATIKPTTPRSSQKNEYFNRNLCLRTISATKNRKAKLTRATKALRPNIMIIYFFLLER